MTNAGSDIGNIASFFREAGFNEATILDGLGVIDYPNARLLRNSRDAFLERTAGMSALNYLIRLFVIGTGLDGEMFDVIPNEQVSLWCEHGIASFDDGLLSGKAEIYPLGENFFACDRADLRGLFDDVMRPAASTLALSEMSIRRKVGSTLDLGTGCGILAVQAAEHSDHVFATDLNERAVEFAKFNARLNSINNIEFASGDLFAPAVGRTFDLIVCNPPFVIGPNSKFQHTSANESADRFCERIARETAQFLNEGGYFQMVCNWATPSGQTAQERIESWFANSGCDAWVLFAHSETASDYALARAKETADDEPTVSELRDDWLEYLERERIESVNFGVVTARKRTAGDNWFRYTQMPPINGACGDSIDLGFRLRDFLESNRNDADILKQTLITSPDLAIKPLSDSRSQISLINGLCFSTTLDRDVVDFVKSCDGKKPLSDQAKEIARRNNASVENVLPSLLRVVRSLVEYGFLRPAA